MFIRVKKIKGKPYSYLVENEWTPWGSRQKVTKYLGKTITLQRLTETTKELPKGKKEAINEAIAQELINHGFIKEGNMLRQEEITINLDEKTVKTKEKNIVIEMNEGYMCEHTIKQLHEFEKTDNHEQNAKKIATLVLEAGLKLTDEQFLHFFEQYKTEKSIENKIEPYNENTGEK